MAAAVVEPWALPKGPCASCCSAKRNQPPAQMLPQPGPKSAPESLPAELQGNGSDVAIPSWKQRVQSLPPTEICQGLGYLKSSQLQRRRPHLGQHHLNRAMAALNPGGAFRCQASAMASAWLAPAADLDLSMTSSPPERRPNARAVALQDAGFRVAGLLAWPAPQLQAVI